MFDTKALFHDMTERFVMPNEPKAWENVTIRLRTGRDQIRRVTLMTDEIAYEMKKELSEEDKNCETFDYFRAEIPLGDKPLSYYFRMETAPEKTAEDRNGAEFPEVLKKVDAKKGRAEIQIVYYDWRGAYIHKPAADNHMAFRLFPGFETPGWAKGAVMYQIFVERFCNGDSSNDVLTDEYHYNGRHTVQVKDWNQYPDPRNDSMEFYGGDLQGVLNKLDYLKDLGIEVIYFNPLFVSPSSHKYDTQDYDHIDPHFGVIVKDEGKLLAKEETDNRKATRFISRVTSKENLEASDALFAKVVQEAHKRDIRVIIDGVFNHCGSFNKWLDKERIYGNGAYESKESPYCKWFDFREDAWPENASYDGWWGYDTLPKINFENSEALQEYILRIGRKWVSAPYYADGWRLDVATDLGHSPSFNHEFWRRFRKAVKDANKDAVILAENYGSSRNWLLGDEWDTIMNYDAFMEPVTWFLTGEEKHSEEFKPELLNNTRVFWKSMRKAIGENFNASSMSVSMNQLSNHDHSRFLTRTSSRPGHSYDLAGPKGAEKGIRKAVYREGAVIQMTWPGAPTLYYGDEAGVMGYTDPDNRRTYPWGHEDQEMIRFHKDIIRIHKAYPEFIRGALIQMDDGNEKGILSYGRFMDGAASLILLNNNRTEKKIEMDVRCLEIPQNARLLRLLCSDDTGYDTSSCHYEVVNGKLCANLSPRTTLILRYEKGWSDQKEVGGNARMMAFE